MSQGDVVIRAKTPLAAAALVVMGAALVMFSQGLPSATAAPVGPVNPVRVDLNGHPANSGFLVFVEGDVALNADESEGTVALGGDLSFASSYNIGAGASPVQPTFTAPGDSQPTFLYVGGGIAWPTTDPVLKVLGNGFTKVADASTYTAHNTDTNNALSNYQITQSGQPYGSQPRIEGTTNAQTPASIAAQVPQSLIDVPGAFTLYRALTAQLGACPTNVVLTNPDTGVPLPDPVPSGARGRLTLTPGVTNVLELSGADLANLAEITFAAAPTASTPLLVNVTGTSLTGTTPNLAGIGGSAAPYILWNFPQATSIVVTGGDTIEGTIYAPNATLNWVPTQNIEGNVIAASFIHGTPAVVASPDLREVHDFPFATTLSCETPTPTHADPHRHPDRDPDGHPDPHPYRHPDRPHPDRDPDPHRHPDLADADDPADGVAIDDCAQPHRHRRHHRWATGLHRGRPDVGAGTCPRPSGRRRAPRQLEPPNPRPVALVHPSTSRGQLAAKRRNPDPSVSPSSGHFDGEEGKARGFGVSGAFLVSAACPANGFRR